MCPVLFFYLEVRPRTLELLQLLVDLRVLKGPVAGKTNAAQWAALLATMTLTENGNSK